MMAPLEVDGRVAVITGGASGIGQATVLALARSGCDIVVADVNDSRMSETVAEIEGFGRRALAVRCDVSRPEDLERLATAAVEGMGQVDILMNNAGVVVGGPLEEIPLRDWEWILGINLFGPIHGVHAFLPHFLARGSGHIVNTASFAGLMAHNPLTIPYDTSKFGVVGFSQGLALYLRPKGIGVSVLCPGYVHTNLSENYRFTGVEAGRAPQVPDRTVEAEDVGELVLAAIRENRFLILSQPEHRDILVRRMQDIDRHMARQLEVLAQAPSP
jgi:NAD(P)-dependent dehydrogenase (short-subunit alcohol dehydrogenase family)